MQNLSFWLVFQIAENSSLIIHFEQFFLHQNDSSFYGMKFFLMIQFTIKVRDRRAVRKDNFRVIDIRGLFQHLLWKLPD